jgi:hypothetical protein
MRDTRQAFGVVRRHRHVAARRWAYLRATAVGGSSQMTRKLTL